MIGGMAADGLETPDDACTVLEAKGSRPTFFWFNAKRALTNPYRRRWDSDVRTYTGT